MLLLGIAIAGQPPKRPLQKKKYAAFVVKIALRQSRLSGTSVERSPFLRRLDALAAPGQPAVASRPAETEIEEIRQCAFELARKVEMLKPPERPVRNP